jgi:hypothetical protein
VLWTHSITFEGAQQGKQAEVEQKSVPVKQNKSKKREQKNVFNQRLQN